MTLDLPTPARMRFQHPLPPTVLAEHMASAVETKMRTEAEEREAPLRTMVALAGSLAEGMTAVYGPGWATPDDPYRYVLSP